jgi:serine O-acetyltransferase
VFPGYYRDGNSKAANTRNALAVLIEQTLTSLNEQIALCLEVGGMEEKNAQEAAQGIGEAFFSRIPHVRQMLQLDLQAAYDGDPAASGMAEIIFAYPGLFAIMVYRLAHELYLLEVPMLPRIMTEYAHSITGIDIHPGVTIGKYFFIDHGTGIVIGQTTVIGDNVKIYQGVTLGALSTRGGQKLRGKRRHPTISDNVTIYAGASILGGDTVIGENCVIGSNVFITSSVAPDTTVTNKNQELQLKARE